MIPNSRPRQGALECCAAVVLSLGLVSMACSARAEEQEIAVYCTFDDGGEIIWELTSRKAIANGLVILHDDNAYAVEISELFISWTKYWHLNEQLDFYENYLIDRRSGEIKRTIRPSKGTPPEKDAAGKCVRLETGKRVI